MIASTILTQAASMASGLKRILVERRWVWIRMPEKHYRGRVTIRCDVRGQYLSEIEMVDPIPNKLTDECYGELANASTVTRAVRMFARGMLEDRKKYIGKGWRPSRDRLRVLWRGRAERRRDIVQPA